MKNDVKNRKEKKNSIGEKNEGLRRGETSTQLIELKMNYSSQS